MPDFVIISDEIKEYHPDSPLYLETVEVVKKEVDGVGIEWTYVNLDGIVHKVESEFCIELPF